MCGRFLLDSSAEDVSALARGIDARLGAPPQQTTRYNVAPTQQHLVLSAGSNGSGATQVAWQQRTFGYLRAERGLLLNARSETAHRLPTFRQAWRKQRCVAIASGFYEWQAPRDKGPKQPYLIREHHGRPFGLAALALGDAAFVIVTTAATSAMAPIHLRMPTMLMGERLRAWLDVDTGLETLNELCAPEAQPELLLVPIGRHVNNPRNDDAACIAPVA